MTQPNRDRIDEIESWFRTQEDGEFCVLPSEHLSTRTGDFANARTIIYTTKARCLPRIDLSRLLAPIATLGRYGLPVTDDFPFLRGSSPARVFIGDSDPPDLLTFAWLREHFPIAWQGVNDDFLIRNSTRELDWIRIPLSESERETVKYLAQLCPDFQELLGDYCSSVLEQGFKIELEGATADPRSAPVL